MGPDNFVERGIARLAEKMGREAVLLGALRCGAGSLRPVTIKHVTTSGLSLLEAGIHEVGARLEVLLRNIGWVPAYVCLSDDIGCEVIFEQYVSPAIPLAA